MTAEEIRKINPLSGQEKLTIELAAQVSELNDNFCRFLDKVDGYLAREDRKLAKAVITAKTPPPPPENESLKRGG